MMDKYNLYWIHTSLVISSCFDFEIKSLHCFTFLFMIIPCHNVSERDDPQYKNKKLHMFYCQTRNQMKVSDLYVLGIDVKSNVCLSIICITLLMLVSHVFGVSYSCMSASIYRHAAASDEGGSIGRQEENSCSDFLCLTNASHWMCRR